MMSSIRCFSASTKLAQPLSGYGIRCYSSKSSVFNLFSRRKEKEEKLKEEELKEEKYLAEEKFIKEEEEFQREEELSRLRNKSRLNFSDRQRLMGLVPNVGVRLIDRDEHIKPEFKAKMLALYGRETGVDPSVAWPTKAEIEDKREYEKVFYDGLTFKEMMAANQANKIKEAEEMARKEKEFTENYLSMRKELKQWKSRVDAKNKLAELERQKRENVLAALKEEYGYAINPQDPQFADKIAEKEKQIAKQLKEEKKKLKIERTTEIKEAKESGS